MTLPGRIWLGSVVGALLVLLIHPATRPVLTDAFWVRALGLPKVASPLSPPQLPDPVTPTLAALWVHTGLRALDERATLDEDRWLTLVEIAQVEGDREPGNTFWRLAEAQFQDRLGNPEAAVRALRRAATSPANGRHVFRDRQMELASTAVDAWAGDARRVRPWHWLLQWPHRDPTARQLSTAYVATQGPLHLTESERKSLNEAMAAPFVESKYAPATYEGRPGALGPRRSVGALMISQAPAGFLAAALAGLAVLGLASFALRAIPGEGTRWRSVLVVAAPVTAVLLYAGTAAIFPAMLGGVLVAAMSLSPPVTLGGEWREGGWAYQLGWGICSLGALLGAGVGLNAMLVPGEPLLWPAAWGFGYAGNVVFWTSLLAGIGLGMTWAFRSRQDLRKGALRAAQTVGVRMLLLGLTLSVVLTPAVLANDPGQADEMRFGMVVPPPGSPDRP
jgi:hypothetical protein